MYPPPQTGNRPGRIEDNQRGRHRTGAEGFSWDLPFARQNQWSIAPLERTHSMALGGVARKFIRQVFARSTRLH